MTNEKRCTKCKVIKSLDRFWEQAAGRFGRSSRCKECLLTERRERKEERLPASDKETRAQKQSLFNRSLKKCISCKEIKPFADFYPKANGRPQSACKECELRRHREWKALNPQHMFDYVKEYHSRPEVAERKARIRKQRRSESPRWTMQVTLAHGLRRIRTEKAATIEDLMQKWRDQSGRCVLTGIEMTWGRGSVLPTSISLDRIDQNQGYSADNLRLICYAVNAFRGRMSDAQMLEIARAIVAKADATSPTWKPYLIHSEAA